MKYALFFFSAFFTSGVSAQNLVPNGSFEEYYSCPITVDKVDSIVNWYRVLNSPDYFNTCAPNSVSIPDNVLGSQFPYEGNAYTGVYTYHSYSVQYREVIGAKLLNKLIVGNTYHVSMRVSRGNETEWINCDRATNKLGIRFTTTKIPNFIVTGRYDTSYITNFAQLYTDSIITDTLNWVLLHWNYVPDSAYAYIYIGNFFKDNMTNTVVINSLVKPGNAYYYIDSVNINCVGKHCFADDVPDISKSSERIFYQQDSKSLSIESGNENSAILSIFNLQGQLLLHKDISGINRVSLSELSSGIYIVRIKTEHTSLVKKIVIN